MADKRTKVQLLEALAATERSVDFWANEWGEHQRKSKELAATIEKLEAENLALRSKVVTLAQALRLAAQAAS